VMVVVLLVVMVMVVVLLMVMVVVVMVVLLVVMVMVVMVVVLLMVMVMVVVLLMVMVVVVLCRMREARICWYFCIIATQQVMLVWSRISLQNDVNELSKKCTDFDYVVEDVQPTGI